MTVTRGAVLSLALLAARGETAVLPDCADQQDHGRVDEARACYEAALRRERDPRVLAEAQWRLGRRQEANALFRRTVAERPKDPEPRIAWGRLFLDSHNGAEAGKLFEEALGLQEKSAAARLGLALVAADNFDERAKQQAQWALDNDPKLAEAHVLLARLDLEEERTREASAHLDDAERLSGSPLPVYALRAAIDLLDDKDESRWVKKALDYNPAYGQAYAVPAHFLVLRRRYPEAAELYRHAVAVDPRLASAQAELGIDVWRLGDEEGAREHLEIAYGLDPFDPVTVNSLRLMDSLKRFDTVRTPRAVLRLHEKETALLRPYVEELLDKAIDTFSAKYGVALNVPVQLEVYPDHEDFAVRTMGMPGLGALGVTFGHVVAMDSPSARPPGSFHWGSTLWHELNHVFVLGYTRRRAPRWIIEGLAVYEESIAGPGWGDHLTPEVITAIREKKLLPILDLDGGFVRPDYPGQVGVSYYQAGLLCEMIAKEWGFPKLLGMLRAYARGEGTAEVVESELGIAPAALDERFQSFVDARTRTVVAAFEPEWKPLMKKIAALRADKKLEAAVEPARRARELFPEYVEPGNAYEVLAEAYTARGDRPSVVQELDRYRLVGGRDPVLLERLAALRVEAGEKEKAREVLEELLWIRPQDEDLHARLGDLLLDGGDAAASLREWQALLALAPADPVPVHYKLALAHHRLRDRAKAREELLLALEEAPGYRPAQKLLLELHRQ
jgi:tetratricopeptide (TPR) repeat protein